MLISWTRCFSRGSIILEYWLYTVYSVFINGNKVLNPFCPGMLNWSILIMEATIFIKLLQTIIALSILSWVKSMASKARKMMFSFSAILLTAKKWVSAPKVSSKESDCVRCSWHKTKMMEKVSRVKELLSSRRLNHQLQDMISRCHQREVRLWLYHGKSYRYSTVNFNNILRIPSTKVTSNHLFCR